MRDDHSPANSSGSPAHRHEHGQGGHRQAGALKMSRLANPGLPEHQPAAKRLRPSPGPLTPEDDPDSSAAHQGSMQQSHMQALHQPKALRQQAARPREQHHNGQDSSGSKGFGCHSQHGGRQQLGSGISSAFKVPGSAAGSSVVANGHGHGQQQMSRPWEKQSASASAAEMAAAEALSALPHLQGNGTVKGPSRIVRQGDSGRPQTGPNLAVRPPPQRATTSPERVLLLHLVRELTKLQAPQPLDPDRVQSTLELAGLIVICSAPEPGRDSAPVTAVTMLVSLQQMLQALQMLHAARQALEYFQGLSEQDGEGSDAGARADEATLHKAADACAACEVSVGGHVGLELAVLGLLQDKAVLVRHLAAHHKAAAERWAQHPLLEQLGRERQRILKQLLKLPMETHPDPLLDLHEQLRQNVLRYMESTAQRSRLQAEMDASLSSLVAAGLAGASSTKVLSGDLDMVLERDVLRMHTVLQVVQNLNHHSVKQLAEVHHLLATKLPQSAKQASDNQGRSLLNRLKALQDRLGPALSSMNLRPALTARQALRQLQQQMDGLGPDVQNQIRMASQGVMQQASLLSRPAVASVPQAANSNGSVQGTPTGFATFLPQSQDLHSRLQLPARASVDSSQARAHTAPVQATNGVHLGQLERLASQCKPEVDTVSVQRGTSDGHLAPPSVAEPPRAAPQIPASVNPPLSLGGAQDSTMRMQSAADFAAALQFNRLIESLGFQQQHLDQASMLSSQGLPLGLLQQFGARQG